MILDTWKGTEFPFAFSCLPKTNFLHCLGIDSQQHMYCSLFVLHTQVSLIYIFIQRTTGQYLAYLTLTHEEAVCWRYIRKCFSFENRHNWNWWKREGEKQQDNPKNRLCAHRIRGNSESIGAAGGSQGSCWQPVWSRAIRVLFWHYVDSWVSSLLPAKWVWAEPQH